jgi:hypothetical protein
MKKVMLTVSLILLSVSVFAQKIIENPKFSATTADYVKITRIELQDTITRIDFEVEYFPNWWIYISSTETYIQNSQGGDKSSYWVQKGLMDEQHKTPQSGKNSTLYIFPQSIPQSSQLIIWNQNGKYSILNSAQKNIFHSFPRKYRGTGFAQMAAMNGFMEFMIIALYTRGNSGRKF